ncbi:MAG: hypothetical protein IKM55_01270 [Bacilli bacterium]|nr:hypothetical protein [Bacilli bacterium]
MNRLLRIGIGCFLCSISLSVIIIYSNLLLYGYSLFEYVVNLLSVIEFYYLFVGIYLIIKKDRF